MVQSRMRWLFFVAAVVIVTSVVAFAFLPREPASEPDVLLAAEGSVESDEVYGFPFTVPHSVLDGADALVSIELNLADSRGYILFYLWKCEAPNCVTLTPNDPFYRWDVNDGTPLEFAKQTLMSSMTHTFEVGYTGMDQHFFFMFAQTVTLPSSQYDLVIEIVELLPSQGEQPEALVLAPATVVLLSLSDVDQATAQWRWEEGDSGGDAASAWRVFRRITTEGTIYTYTVRIWIEADSAAATARFNSVAASHGAPVNTRTSPSADMSACWMWDSGRSERVLNAKWNVVFSVEESETGDPFFAFCTAAKVFAAKQFDKLDMYVTRG